MHSVETPRSLRCPLCHDPLSLRQAPSHVQRCAECATAFHRLCFAELGGCSTLGCAAHSRSARRPIGRRRVTAAARRQPRPRRITATNLALLPLAWIGFGHLWPFALPHLIAAVLSSVFSARPRLNLLFALALSPLCVVPLWSTAEGVYGYVSGTGRVRSDGGASNSTIPNLDRATRCATQGMRLRVVGNEAFTRGPASKAIRALSFAFGPMPGAYRGVYPSEEDVQLIGRTCPDALLDLEQVLDREQLTVAGVDYALSPRQRAQLSQVWSIWPGDALSVWVLEGECLVLAHLQRGAYAPEVVLADARAPRFFACHFLRDGTPTLPDQAARELGSRR